MSFKEDSENSPLRGLGNPKKKKDFKKYLEKAQSIYDIDPSTKSYLQQKAGTSTNKLLRARILANYGLNIGKNKYFSTT